MVGQSVEANTVSILETTGGHHSVVRKFVPEGSQVSLQCRVPANSQLSRMMDQVEPSLIPAVIWLRVDMNGMKSGYLPYTVTSCGFDNVRSCRSVQPGDYLSRRDALDWYQSPTTSSLRRRHSNIDVDRIKFKNFNRIYDGIQTNFSSFSSTICWNV